MVTPLPTISSRQLDKRHPSARGLWLALLPGNNGGLCIDQASGYTAVCAQGSYIQSGVFVCPSTSPGAVVVTHTGRGFFSGNFTFAMDLVILGGMSFARYASQEGLGGSQIALNQNDALSQFEVLSSGVVTVQPPTWGVNRRLHFCFVRDGASATIYTNGLSRGSFFAGTDSATANRTAFFNRASDYNRALYCRCASIYAWDRAIGPDEAFALATDPMFMLANTRRTYFSPAAPTGVKGHYYRYLLNRRRAVA